VQAQLLNVCADGDAHRAIRNDSLVEPAQAAVLNVIGRQDKQERRVLVLGWIVV
jgi:hypothetical protein